MQADEHIPADWLAGWSEGQLTDVEREQVEFHLARCRECRSMLTSLSPMALVDSDSDQLGFFAEQDARATSTGRPWAPLLLAASVLLIAALGLRFAALENLPPKARQLRVASAAEDLWSPARSASSSDVFHLGLQLTQPAQVELLALMADGRLLPMPLDTAGAMRLSFAGESLHSLGPYPRMLGGTEVTRLLVIQTEVPLPADWLSHMQLAPLLTQADQIAFTLALASTHDARVESILISLHAAQRRSNNAGD